MKETTVSNIQFNHEWTSSRGTAMFTFDIEFGDGEFGQVNSTGNPPPYKIGDTVWVQQQGTTPKGDKKFRVQKNNPTQQSGGGFVYNKSKADVVGLQWAINAARETLVSRGEDVTVEALEMWARELIKLRGILENAE